MIKVAVSLFLLISVSGFVVKAWAQEVKQDETIKINTNLVSVPVVARADIAVRARSSYRAK